MKLRLTLVCATLLLAACTHQLKAPPKPQTPPPPPPVAALEFQFGQQVTLQVDNTTDPALAAAFVQWAGQGVYTATPVYRQLPGVFILTGKPRLAGQPYQAGLLPTPLPKNKKPKEATSGYAGLVLHADGTAGPELVITYGMCLRAYCEGPANIRIAKIVEGQSQLKSVQRGDNLINIAIQP